MLEAVSEEEIMGFLRITSMRGHREATETAATLFTELVHIRGLRDS